MNLLEKVSLWDLIKGQSEYIEVWLVILIIVVLLIVAGLINRRISKPKKD